MTYVLDTNVISHFVRSMNPISFRNFWLRHDSSIMAGRVTSTREVLHELNAANRQELRCWANAQDFLFPAPTAVEATFVRTIFSLLSFRDNLEMRKLVNGGNNADAFVIARAKVLSGMVVTQESKWAHGARIPNICEYFCVPCVKLDEFMQLENWTF